MSINKRWALLSVSDKRGIVDLAGQLKTLGFELLSTGGTARVLKDAGLVVTAVSEVTGFPEILQGRVKTLHPRIHGAILGRPDLRDDLDDFALHGIDPIEIVVVNLYPFEETINRENFFHDEALETIDIGGPTMIRAAAKNHNYVTVVVNPDRYQDLSRELQEKGKASAELRRSLAAEAFAHTAYYDAAIAAYFNRLEDDKDGNFPFRLTLGLNKIQDLRYGENPQQQAAFYTYPGKGEGLAAAVQLKGKELSFNNINDLSAAWVLVLEFDKPTVVAVKHANPCGVGSAKTVAEAYCLAHDADPVSIFGGVLAVNSVIDGDAARQIGDTFLEVVAAPRFTDEALGILSRKKDLRLLQVPITEIKGSCHDIKAVAGGVLLQTIDREPVKPSSGSVVSKRTPTADDWLSLEFAQKVVKHVRSNAIVVVSGEQTVGIGAGQTSRIGAAKIALEQAGSRADGAVIGSDAFFPFPDVVEMAAKAGIKAIAQPGGSQKDQESIALCDHYGLSMVFTGRRYFKH